MTKVFVIILLMVNSIVAFAQLSQEIPPHSFRFGVDKFASARIDFKSYTLPNVDNEQEIEKSRAIKEKNCVNCRMEYIGKTFEVDLDIKKEGKLIETEEGNVWIFHVNSNSAFGFQFYFKEFDIPENATLHIYSPTTEHILGAFTKENVHVSHRFATGILPGNNAIIEYFEPKISMSKGSVVINSIAHIFRSLGDIGSVERGGEGAGWKTSGSCTVNTICNGAITNEAKAVAFFTRRDDDFNLIAMGSGFLITTTEDASFRRPYFMTAGHCVQFNKPSEYFFSDYIFYFNYQSSTCVNQLSNPFFSARSFQGAYLKSMADHNWHNNQADYALLELNDKPQNSIEVAYLGWDRRQTGQTGTVYNIGHPRGDAKKVAVGSNPQSKGSMIYKSCLNRFLQIWQVSWTTGVTQSISSGSVLLNSSKRVIGLLHGGLSRCNDSPIPTGLCTEENALSGPDFFQRMDWAWNHPGELPTTQGYSYNPLSSFLDPSASGALFTDSWFPAVPPGGGGTPPSPCLPRRATDPSSFKLSLPDDTKRKFGWAVAADGNYIVVGAYGDRKVYIYKKENCNIIRKAQLISDDATGKFGYSVDIQGDQIIVGDPGDGTSNGSAYIFTRSGETWTRQTKFYGEPDFGYSVAIHGSNSVVGSPKETSAYGMAYFYRKNSSGVWNSSFRNLGQDINGGFGKSVDIKDERAVVGAPDESNYIYIYDYKLVSGSMIWANTQIYTTTGGIANWSDFGEDVDLKEDGNEVVASGGGAVSFQFIDGSWIFKGGFTTQYGERYRGSVSILGEYVVISEDWQGHIFKRNSSGTYALVNTALKDVYDREDDDKFGKSTALTNEFFIVGSPETRERCTYSGSAYVYDLSYFISTNPVDICNNTYTSSSVLPLARSVTFAGTGCTVTCLSGSNTTVTANESITLKPGFWAKSGSKLSASLMGCANFSNGTNPGGGRVRTNDDQSDLDIVERPVEETQIIRIESKHDNSMLSIYPNPTFDGTVTIASELGEISSIEVFNISGQLVNAVQFNGRTEKLITLNLPPDANGIYLIRAIVNGKIYTEKVSFK